MTTTELIQRVETIILEDAWLKKKKPTEMVGVYQNNHFENPL